LTESRPDTVALIFIYQGVYQEINKQSFISSRALYKMVSFGLFAITAKNKTTDAHTIGK
jgi:hypothetical protein